MANNNSEARARVSLDSAPFVAGARAIVNAANAMSAAVTKAFATAGLAVAASFGANGLKAILNSMKSVIDLGEKLANAGKRAGLAAGQFLLFNQAVEKGLSMKTVAGLIGNNAQILDRSASLFRDVAIKLWAIGEKIRGFWLGLMERLSPVLSRLLDGALASSLVAAGEAFGAAMSKAIAVIYQLTSEGTLWKSLQLGFKIAFDYAAERLLWLGGIAYEVLKQTFSQAFVDGVLGAISIAWESIKLFAQNFGEQLGAAFFNFWTDIVELMNGLLNKIDVYLSRMGLLSEKAKEANAKQRSEEVVNRRIVGKVETFQPKPETNFATRISEIFKRNQFAPSEKLSDNLKLFGKTIDGAFNRFNADTAKTPATTFENNTRRAAFGADSLAGIGAGGNVSLGLNTLTVNQRQLDELREINKKLGPRTPQQSATFAPFAPQSPGITRNQTTSPVTITR